MKKIPTIFERDWEGDRSRVLDVPNPACDWVFRGEGRGTQKLDGSCCMAQGGMLFKRHAVKGHVSQGIWVADGIIPAGFRSVELEQPDAKGNVKNIGWVLVGDGPEDEWHREALRRQRDDYPISDGTYELIGPKVNGNPEEARGHHLVAHGTWVYSPPTDFEKLKEWFRDKPMEGIVWHHDDGRMAKIKAKDFGLKRAKKS